MAGSQRMTDPVQRGSPFDRKASTLDLAWATSVPWTKRDSTCPLICQLRSRLRASRSSSGPSVADLAGKASARSPGATSIVQSGGRLLRSERMAHNQRSAVAPCTRARITTSPGGRAIPSAMSRSVTHRRCAGLASTVRRTVRVESPMVKGWSGLISLASPARSRSVPRNVPFALPRSLIDRPSKIWSAACVLEMRRSSTTMLLALARPIVTTPLDGNTCLALPVGPITNSPNGLSALPLGSLGNVSASSSIIMPGHLTTWADSRSSLGTNRFVRNPHISLTRMVMSYRSCGFGG